MTLAELLKEKRHERGQSQRKAADEVGVNGTTWLQWERGQLPRADALYRIADWLGVPMSELRDVVESSAQRNLQPK